MYLRHTIRKKDGKAHRYWRLVRSVRVRRRVIQQTVAHLGELDERRRFEARVLARKLIGAPEESQLFDSRDVTVPVRLKGIRNRAFAPIRRCVPCAGAVAGMRLDDQCEQL